VPDVIFQRFLDNAAAEAEDLADRSDVLSVHTDPRAPATFWCEFAVPYLQRLAGGLVGIHPGPVLAAVHFPPDYLRSTDPHLYLHVAAVATPRVAHPNIRGSGVCLGSAFRAGTRLGIILRELYEIFTYSNYSLVESNSLNPEACRLLRAHGHLLEDLAPRPFVRRTPHLRVRVSPL
jgi:hypothetical protein